MRAQLPYRLPIRGLAVLAALVWTAPALAAGGAFAVDDAEIGNPGDCKVESWASAATNHDLIATTSPACVVKLGIPVELTGQFQRTRTGGEWDTAGLVQAKSNLIPVANHPFGLGIFGGSTWDFITGANTGGFVTVPVTLQLRDDFRVNLKWWLAL